MLLNSILNHLQTRRMGRRVNHGYATRRPRFETFEGRRLLSLSPAVNYSGGLNPQEIVTADFNNDGRLDLATLNPVDDIEYTRVKVSVLLGDGAGGFGAAINSDVGANLYTTAARTWRGSPSRSPTSTTTAVWTCRWRSLSK